MPDIARTERPSDDTIPTITVKPGDKADGEGKPIAKGAKLSRDQISALIKQEMPGLSAAGTEGVVRNVMRESGGDSSQIGDGGTSGGMFQHHNTRFADLKAFAKSAGTDWQDPVTQVRFAAGEMKKSYPTLLAQLKRADDPAEAEDSFKRVFERPASILWANKPKLDSDRYRFSDYALGEHKGRKNTDLVYMSPGDYLDLAPDFEAEPRTSASGKSLKNSLDRGDEVEAIPTLDMRVKGNTGTVTDQDGRHRALMAQDEGIESIPVAIRTTKGKGEPSEIQGLSGTVLPYDFPKAEDAPPSLFKRAMGALIPSAEAAEPKGDNPFAQFLEPEKPSNQEKPKTATDNPFAQYLKPDAPDGALVSGLKGASEGFARPVFAAQEMLGKGLEAIGIKGAGKSLVDDARERMTAEAEKTAADREAHPYATGIGDFAGNLASQALLFKGGLGGSNAMRAATGGALFSALEPTGDDHYWWKKTGAAAFGAGAGLAGNAILGRVARWIEPKMRPIHEFVERVTGQPVEKNPAAAAVVKRMEEDARAGGPTAQQMLDLANATPEKPLTIADLGGPRVQGLTGRIARGADEGGAKLKNFLNERDKGAGQRLGGDVDREIGAGSSYQLTKAMEASRAAAAKPLYEAAYAHPPINPDEMVLPGGAQRAGSIGALIARPSFQSAMANAIKLAREEGVSPVTLGIDLDAQGVPVFTKVPTWKTLDYVKRGMDDHIENTWRNKVTGRLDLDYVGRAANNTRTEFRGALKKLNEPYARALDAYSGVSTSLDALHAGEDFLKRTPEEIADRIATFGAGDREFYRLGAADTLRTALRKTAFSGDEAKKIINSQYMREQLGPLFESEAAYKRFTDSVTAEGRMFGTRFNALGGSQTAERRAEDTSPEVEAMVHAARGVVHAKYGNALGMAAAAAKTLRALASRGDPAKNAGIADILSTPIAQDPTRARLQDFKTFMSSLPTTSAHMNRNALADMTRAAGPMAGAAMAQIPQMFIHPQKRQDGRPQ